MPEEQTEFPGMEPMPTGQKKESLDARKEFSDLLDEMTFREPNKEVDQRFKEVLKSLDEEGIRNLLGFRNPGRFAKDMLRRGVKKSTLPDRAKLAFLDRRVDATDEFRARTDRLLSNLRGSNIKSGVITSFKSNATPSEFSDNDNIDPKPEDILDKYNFDEAGKPCSMAMVVHMRDDGEVGFVSSHVPAAPPNTKEDLTAFWQESFKYDQPNQYFLFFMGGEWHTINSRDEILPIPKEDLVKVWRDAMKRRSQMH